MKIINEESWRMIAARATFPWERECGLVVPVEDGNDPHSSRLRIARWDAVVSGESGGGRLTVRLAAQRLRDDDIAPLLGAVRLADDQPTPDWVHNLDAILAAAEGTTIDAFVPPSWDRALDGDDPIPYEHILLIFLYHARSLLGESPDDTVLHFEERAKIAFERNLLKRLSILAAQSFQLERMVFEAKTGRRSYVDFVEHFRGEVLVDFFEEYAVLGRLMSEEIERWVRNVSEIYRRIREDFPKIVAMFHGFNFEPVVVDARVGLSDRHCDGQTVVILYFSGGKGIVYKPKSLRLDIRLRELLEFTASGGNDTSLDIPRLLDCGDYGYQELICPRDCQDDEAVGRFFFRCGQTLALVHALNGVDVHGENLVASGEFPVVVDAETLLQPRIRAFGNGPVVMGNDKHTSRLLNESVLATDLLPEWLIDNNGGAIDIGGLSAELGISPGGRLEWQGINTDEMELLYVDAMIGGWRNLPTVDGCPVSPLRHRNRIIEGFEFMHQKLESLRDDLLAPDGLIAKASSDPIRVILRPTATYARTMKRLVRPGCLRDGIDFGIEIEALTRPFVASESSVDEPDVWLAVYRAECRAIARMDVPSFYVRADDKSLVDNDAVVVVGFFEMSGIESCRLRLGSFDSTHRQGQLAIVRASLASRYNLPDEHLIPPMASSNFAGEISLMSVDELTSAAEDLAGRIRSSVIGQKTLGPTWVELRRIGRSEFIGVAPLDESFYDGRCGIALFLAAFHSLTGDAKYRDLVMEIIESIDLEFARRGHDISQFSEFCTGGYDGLGGILYSLSAIAMFLGDRQPSNLARRLVEMIDFKRVIRDDVHLDIIGGCSGLILGLIAYGDSTGDPNALATAEACGRHLLDMRTKTSSGRRSWMSQKECVHLAGFSHGASGFACALIRLSERSGFIEFCEAAIEALDYEETLYDEASRNWIDLRSSQAPSTARRSSIRTWCHGSPGIAMSRLSLLSDNLHNKNNDILNKAIEGIRFDDMNPVDHLCCGDAGRIDALLEVSLRLDRPEILHECHQRARLLLKRYGRTGKISFNEGLLCPSLKPSLFQGAAGIGYEFLRLINPRKFDSVLLNNMNNIKF